jgi:hypothetical protein
MINNVDKRVLAVLKAASDKEFQEKYLIKEGAYSREGSQRMTFEDMTMFVLSNTGKTLSLEILKYFNDTNNVENTITKQAVSKQRKNIKSELFEGLNKMYIAEVYKTRSETYSGYHVIAVDGSTTEIPNTKNLKEIFGNAKASETSASNARAGLNGFYDSLNNLMIKLVVGKYQRGEKTVFLENVKEILEMYEEGKVLFIFDRGYICLELLLELDKLGVKYLFRVPSNCYKNEMGLAKTNDEKINIKITKARLKNIEQEQQKIYLEKEYKEERLVQIELDTGEIEYLITNLSVQEAPYAEMKDLYYKRWNIEKTFNILKNRLHIENITSRTKNGVEQEIQATVFLGNIIEDMSKEINLQIPKKEQNKHEYRVNINLLSGVLKTYFIYFFCTKVIDAKVKEKYYKEMLKFIKKNIVASKKGLKNPRIKKVSRNKHKTNLRKNM